MAKTKSKHAKRKKTISVKAALTAVDRGKVEELATEVAGKLPRNGAAPFLSPEIIAAIAAAIISVIQAIADCQQRQTLSQAVRRMNFRARLRADRAIQQQLYHHRVHGVRSRDVLDLTRDAMLARGDRWMDEMSNEVQQPDWGM